jgi:hypothetical protein
MKDGVNDLGREWGAFGAYVLDLDIKWANRTCHHRRQKGSKEIKDDQVNKDKRKTVIRNRKSANEVNL